jgi:hypothetical protein
MNAFTHVYLSMVFKKAIESKLPVKLHTLSFIKGNLKPDFSLLLIKVPHYKIPTSELVKREMDKLIRHKPDKYTTCTNDFSERLGVVTHYLSDFFCYAHSPNFKGSIVDHYLYERKLSRYRKAMKGKIMNLTGGVPYARYNTDYQSICGLLDRLHAKYQSKKPSYARDLVYTLRAGIPLAISLVTACLQLSETQLAA